MDLKTIKVKVDCTTLEDLLIRQQWQAADKETYQLMIKAAKRENEGWLREKDVHDFSYKILSNIDGLWTQYSKGRFGFSCQKRIYKCLGGSKEFNLEIWDSFCEIVGWYQENETICNEHRVNLLDFPPGYFPNYFGSFSFNLIENWYWIVSYRDL